MSFSYTYLGIPLIICSNAFKLLHIVGGSNPRKGDALVIAGATLYAVSNVSEVREFLFLLLRTSYVFSFA